MLLRVTALGVLPVCVCARFPAESSSVYCRHLLCCSRAFISRSQLQEEQWFVTQEVPSSWPQPLSQGAISNQESQKLKESQEPSDSQEPSLVFASSHGPFQTSRPTHAPGSTGPSRAAKLDALVQVCSQEESQSSQSPPPSPTTRKRGRTTEDPDSAELKEPGLKAPCLEVLTFGTALQVDCPKLVVPYGQPCSAQESQTLRQALQEDSLLAVVLWTLLHRCHNTVTGQVALFYATLNHAGAAYPVVVGHWSLWHRLCGQCYSAFHSRQVGIGFLKEQLQQAFQPYVVSGLARVDLVKLHRVTGADVTPARRVLKESHFLLSAHLVRALAHHLAGVTTVEALLVDLNRPHAPTFCTDQTVTLRGLRQYQGFEVSSFQIVKNKQHSKFSAAAFMGAPDPTFDDLTPAFGIPWSQEQLRVLRSVTAFFWDTPGPIQHWTTFFQSSAALVQQRATLKRLYAAGVPDDSSRRGPVSRTVTDSQSVTLGF